MNQEDKQKALRIMDCAISRAEESGTYMSLSFYWWEKLRKLIDESEAPAPTINQVWAQSKLQEALNVIQHNAFPGKLSEASVGGKWMNDYCWGELRALIKQAMESAQPVEEKVGFTGIHVENLKGDTKFTIENGEKSIVLTREDANHLVHMLSQFKGVA